MTLLYFLATIPSIKSNAFPRKIIAAHKYKCLITKTKKIRDGILPIRVNTLGFTLERGSTRGSKYFSICGFLSLNMTDNKYKVDLHTHSIISHDGGISKKQYIRLLNERVLDYVAITDHNETGFAKAMQREIGAKIIIGEEITTLDGEIIGLFLTKTIPPGLTAKETIEEIHSDGGLVYVPHPFETLRSGLQEDILKTIIKDVDIVEIFNARGLIRGKPAEALELATIGHIASAASSDAHCIGGIGTSFSQISKIPTRELLVALLREAKLQKEYAPWYSLFCPGFNRIKNKLVL